MGRRALLAGVGKSTPPLVTNNDFIRAFGKRAAVVDRMIPHKSRYCGIDLSTGEALAWNSEMACAASMEALAMAGVEKDDVDMIILASASPDRLLPPGFTGIQRMLGIDECMGMDIRSGCSGFGAAMITAQLFIESFRARTVLVVGSELNSTRSSFLFKEGREKFPLHALFNLMLFGDGAGAVVLQAADAEDEGIFCSSMASTKPCAPSGSRIEVGGSMAPFPVDAIRKEDWIITQEPKLTSEMIPLVFCEAVQKFIHENGLSLDSFDTFVFPVDSPHILERVLEGLPGLDEQRIVSIGSEGGSMVNASIPVSLCRAFEEGRLGKGRRILIYAAENTQWQHAIIGLDGSF